MKLERREDGSLSVRASPLGLRLLLLALAAGVLAAVFLAQPRDDTRRVLGTLGALLPLAGAALLERVHFDFDAVRRQLRWQRRSWLRRRSGELRFDAIRDVEVGVRRQRDTRRGPESPAYFVTLVTSAGPLRLSDRMYADEATQRAVADAIRAVLGLAAARPGPEEAGEFDPEIARLAASGEGIEAVKLARERLGLDLTRAKQLVERLRRGTGAPRIPR